MKRTDIRGSDHPWIHSFPGSIIVCDPSGIIVEMNEAAVESHRDDGGAASIGTSLLACHPEPSRSKVEEMLRSNAPNYYTIEKHGKKKLVYQVPWHRDGVYAGIVEMVLPIPFEMPHFIRK